MSTNQETQIEILAQPRQSGKHNSRSLRREMKIPSVVYGNKIENKNIWISFNDASKCISHKNDNTIFVLKSQEDPSLNGLKVIRRKVDVHPLSRKPLHFDFYAPNLEKVKKYSVRIEYNGQPKGVALGGHLSVLKREVQVECIPALAPKTLKIDLSSLDIGQSLNSSQINAGENVRVIDGEDVIFVKVDATKG